MKRFGAVAIVVAVVVAALVAGSGPLLRWFPVAAQPPVLGQVPSFRLVSDNGAVFDSSSLDGRVWLASFLFTSCPGPCPRLVERLKSVRRAIPAERMAMVSFSVDPTVDTPAVLAAYKKARGIGDDAAWTFVTGPAGEVIDLVQHGFLTGVEASDAPEDEGAVIHGVRVALVDGERRIRGFYSTENDEDLRRLESEVAALQ